MDEQLTQCPVARRAKLTPDLIALETNTKSISFAELDLRIAHLSSQLINLKMKKADRLVVIASNGLPSILLMLTCLRNGFVFCPINPKFSQAERQQRLSILKSTFIWQETKTHLQQSLSLDFSPTKKTAVNNQVINIDPFAVVSIIFTSGSSGLPKAVMHHFSNHYYSALGSQTVIPLVASDKNLLSLPLFHISGYATVMRSIIAAATVVIKQEKITTSSLTNAGVTHLSLVSTQLQQLLEDDQFQAHQLTIKHLLLGGSRFPSALLQAIQQRGFTYHLSYGSTEMASQVATSTNSEKLRLLPYRKLKIIDNEIYLSGKTRFIGYFSSETNETSIEPESYFPSSDLGQLTEQILTVTGRKDRQFISGGENIQPEEIEQLLLTFPAVSQAFVLPITDTLYGQRPIAFIKWKKDVQSKQLKCFVQDKLVSFKQPIQYLLLPEQMGLKPNLKQLTDIATEQLLSH